MREVIFRGKRIDNGEWIYGDLLTPTDIMDIWEISENTGMGDRYEIDPETVGQYTGLKDKNGKKIFEGDIVKFARKAIVKWHESFGGFVLFFYPDEKDSSKLHWMMFDIGVCPYEVIGNIHENSVGDI